MTVEEMEEKAVALVKEEAYEKDGFEADPYTDLTSAIEMLSNCATLLNYMGNPILCKSVTKQERNNMLRVAINIVDFVNGVELPDDEE